MRFLHFLVSMTIESSALVCTARGVTVQSSIRRDLRTGEEGERGFGSNVEPEEARKEGMNPLTFSLPVSLFHSLPLDAHGSSQDSE